MVIRVRSCDIWFRVHWGHQRALSQTWGRSQRPPSPDVGVVTVVTTPWSLWWLGYLVSVSTELVFLLQCWAGLGWVAPGWVAVRGKLPSVSKYSRAGSTGHTGVSAQEDILQLAVSHFLSLSFSIFTASDQMWDVPRAAPMGLLWCHGLEDQLTGATAWCCHGWPQSGPSPLLRIIQPKQIHNNTEYIHQEDTQWPLNVVYNSVKH